MAWKQCKNGVETKPYMNAVERLIKTETIKKEEIRKCLKDCILRISL